MRIHPLLAPALLGKLGLALCAAALVVLLGQEMLRQVPDSFRSTAIAPTPAAIGPASSPNGHPPQDPTSNAAPALADIR